MNDLVRDIIKGYSNISDYNNKIKFESNISDNNIPLKVIGDKNRIGQVIINLINNSIKFISKDNGDGDGNQKGTISVSVKKASSISNDTRMKEKEMAMVAVKDNGKGIDLEIFPRLFTKFVSKSFRGTGLGLYIAKNIIESHGGNIWGQNNKDEKGATFYFTLPLAN